ncbi:hypothetical protein V6N13_131550 [Hibiscus sabdariffa]|uniref:PSI subunit V n=1 Tax=Hibiscus sabdariffa TaxID=183260 RepID=A0ABR2D883_9ROSI
MSRTLEEHTVAGGAGSLEAAGLVVILSICLTMYGTTLFNEGEPSTVPSLTLTGRKKEPDHCKRPMDGLSSPVDFSLVAFRVSPSSFMS